MAHLTASHLDSGVVHTLAPLRPVWQQKCSLVINSVESAGWIWGSTFTIF